MNNDPSQLPTRPPPPLPRHTPNGTTIPPRMLEELARWPDWAEESE